MSDNVMDTISIEIDANAKNAINSLNRMQNSLRSAAKSIGTLQSGNEGLGRSFQRLNLNNLTGIVNQLERLDKINLKDLDGKTVKLDIKINGADEAERKIYAMQDAVKKVDTKALSKKFNDMLGLKGFDAKQVGRVFDQAVAELSSGGTGNQAFTKWLSDVSANGLSISKSTFRADIAAMKEEYASFLKFVQQRPFHVSADAYRSEWNEQTFQEGFGRFFSKAKESARSLDGDWQDMASRFPTIFTADDAAVQTEEDQINTLIAKIKEARDALKTVDIRELTGTESDNAWASMIGMISDAPKQLQETFNKEVQNLMKESANKIPIDVDIDAGRIEKQIASAVKTASSKKYDLPLNFQFGELQKNLKSSIASTIAGANIEQLGDFASHMQSAASAMANIASFKPKESGITGFVNSLKRLAEVDMTKFSTGALAEIVNSISKISEIGDIEAGVNRLVSALARLAAAGGSTRTTAKFLPSLGEALGRVARGITSAGALPSELNAFVSSISQLANAGNKTSATAMQLGELGNALKALMENLQGAPLVSENLIKMTEALGTLAKSGGKAGTAAKTVNKSVGNIASGSDSATNKMQLLSAAVSDLGNMFKKAGSLIKQGAHTVITSLRSIKSAGSGMGTVTNNIKSLLGAMIGFRGLTGAFNWVKEAVTMGGDLTEIDHIVESVFGDMQGYVNSWAETAITQFGIAEVEAKKYAGTLSSMFQASGVGYRDAGKIATDLVELAGDLSAFYNIDTDTAYEKIKSGMAGMVRPLRDLGIDLTAATLEEYRLSQGIETAYSKMTQAEKELLRYNYLMSVTGTQQGDFTRTNQSLANSLRTLKAYLSSVTTQIGVGLAAAIRPAIVALNKLMKYIVAASKAFATFMQTLFGKYKGGASGIAMDMAGMEDDTAGVADAADGIGDALDNADDTAKKLKKDLSVLPFDELNQLNKDSESNASKSGSGSGASGLGGAFGDLSDGIFDVEDMVNSSKLPDAISEWAERIKRAFKSKNWDKLGEEIAWGINKGIDAIYDALDTKRFKEKVTPWIDAFTQTFNSLVDHIHWNKLGRALGRGINDLVYVINRGIEGINWENLGAKLAEGANGLVDEVDFEAIGNMFGNKFMIAWNILYGFADRFEWDKLGKKLGDGLNGLNDKINWSRVAEALTTSFNGLFETLKEFSGTVKWEEIAKNITDGLNTAIHTFKWKENGEALGEFIDNLLDSLIYIIDNTDWYGFGQGLADALQEIPWGKLLLTVGKVIVKAIGGTLAGLATTPAGLFSEAFLVAMGAKKLILGTEIGKQVITPSLLNAFKSGGVRSAIKSGTSLIGSSFVGGLALKFAGITAITGGVIIGIQSLAKEIDKAQGGNGKLTSMGTALQAYFGKVQGVSTDAQESLWQMVESQEDAGASSEEMAKTTVAKLAEMGISYENAKGALDEYAAQHTMTAEDAQILYDALDDGKDLFVQNTESVEDATKGYDLLKDALYSCAYDGADELGGMYSYLLDVVDQSKARGESSVQAWQNVQKAMDDAGVSTDALSGKLEENGGTHSTLVSTVKSGNSQMVESTRGSLGAMQQRQADYIKTVQENTEKQKTELEKWQGDVQEFHDSASEKLKNLGTDWGNLGTDQAQSLSELNSNLEDSIEKQNTAIENMRILNEKGLDDATVQAILKQVDPSSEAMNDLIAHMQADDETWNTFHSNIEKNLSMTDSIDKTLDDMTTEFAKKTAPAFVSVGDNFKTEGGKIGGFMVDGVKTGVLGSVSEAEQALDKLANDSIAAFKKEAGINSPSTVMAEQGKYLVQGAANGVTQNAYLLRDSITKMMTTATETFTTWAKRFENLAKQIPTYIEKGLTGISTPFTKAFADLNKELTKQEIQFKNSGQTMGKNFMEGIRSQLSGQSLNNDMYNAGMQLGTSFANGLKSAYIATPHLYVSERVREYSSDNTWWYEYPRWAVSWYKAGGLFKGGNGQIIGIGEQHRDEAVLPLENSKAMARIGGAIADASSGIGLSKDDVVEAVVEAMMANQQSQEIIVNAVLKTQNDEVLARAVERGRQKIDNRFKPTPSMA